MKKYCHIILILLFATTGATLYASPKDSANAAFVPRIPTPQAIEQYKNDKDFDYDKYFKPTTSWWQDFKNWLWKSLRDLFDFPETSVNLNIVYIIIWVFIAIAIAAVIYFIFRNEITLFLSKRNSRNSQSLKTEFIDIAADATTLETQLQNAINSKNYAEGVRLYYTLLLKQLVDAGLIDFRIDKTNSEYLFELPKDALKQPFRQITFYFDYIFYGKFEATEAIFYKTQEQYNQLTTLLNKTVAK